MALTQKQQDFARKVVELKGRQSDAYREVYNCAKMKPETVRNRAYELVNNGDVAAMIAKLQERAAKQHDVTVASLLAELEEARQVALGAETPQSSAAVAASMGKAKLCGLDKQVIELTADVTMRRTLDDFYGDA